MRDRQTRSRSHVCTWCIENSIGRYVVFCWRQWRIESFYVYFFSFCFWLQPSSSDPRFLNDGSAQFCFLCLLNIEQSTNVHACLVSHAATCISSFDFCWPVDAVFFFLLLSFFFLSLLSLLAVNRSLWQHLRFTHSISIDSIRTTGDDEKEGRTRSSNNFHSQWHCRLILFLFLFPFRFLSFFVICLPSVIKIK